MTARTWNDRHSTVPSLVVLPLIVLTATAGCFSVAPSGTGGFKPAAAPPDIDGSKYAAYAGAERETLGALTQGPEYERASRDFERLKQVAGRLE